MWNKICSLSVGLRVAAITLTVLAAVVLVNNVVFVRGFTQSAEAAIVEEAKVFTALADETKDHVSSLHKIGAFNEELLLKELKADIDAGRGYRDSKIFQTIPVVAGWLAAGEAAKREGLDFHTPAFNARNPENEPKPGTFKHRLLSDLEAKVAQNAGEDIFRIDPETNTLAYMRAIKLETSCLMCHGDPSTSPTGDGKDVLGFPMENWKAGQVHGAFLVEIPLTKMDEQVASFITQSLEWSIPLFIASAVLIGWLMRRILTRPIGRIVEALQAIATRDLTKPLLAVSTSDEVGKLAQATDSMTSNLIQMITEIRSGATQIDAGGTQIASASQSLAQGASEQASSLEQISASIEQISGQTQQAAENARQAATLAEESKKSADRGQHEMTEMNKAVSEIKQSSSEISKIIKVIDEIAFQTNLLALNAAVEAARAGEAGKGFAVVAEEVRNLAQRSAEAAKNTSAMIEESVKRSENGVAIASRVGTALEEITGATNKVNALLAEIASASGEQATGIGQVNQGVSQLDQVTQQNAGNSEELASSAEELSSQVASLNDLVSQFKVDERKAPTRDLPPRASARPSVKSGLKPAGSSSKPQQGASRTNVTTPSPEDIIPMDSNETLAKF